MGRRENKRNCRYLYCLLGSQTDSLNEPEKDVETTNTAAAAASAASCSAYLFAVMKKVSELVSFWLISQTATIAAATDVPQQIK